jgi:hypothetical protein
VGGRPPAPPATATDLGRRNGAAYTARWKKPVTFKVESPPKGMTVDGAGLVRWAVPANFAEEGADVILAAKDAAGYQVFQTFALTPTVGK